MAERGFRVFPLAANSKKGAASGWTENATSDPNEIRELWTRGGEVQKFNVGVLTTGHCVLDVDVKGDKEGAKSLAELRPLPNTLICTTPTGGTHMYYTGVAVNNGVDVLGDGLDVRGVNGYVVGPGSEIDGRPYAALDLTGEGVYPRPAKVPEHVLNRLREVRRRTEVEQIGELDLPPNIEAVKNFLQNEEPAVEGQGGDHKTFWVAAWCRDKALSPGVVLQLMMEHYNPRCVPPWDVDALEAKVDNAFQFATNALGASAPTVLFDEVVIPGVTDAPALPERVSDRPDWYFGPMDIDSAWDKIPPRDWIATDFYLRKYLTLFVAPGGVGKSMVTLSHGIALSRGCGKFIGLDVVKPSKVLVINNEDDPDEMFRRLRSVAKRFDIKQAEMRGRIMSYLPGAGKIKLVSRESGKLQITEDAKELVRFCKQEEIDVIIIDPLVEMHDAEENDNGEMSFVVETLKSIARETDTSICLVHHTTKPPQGSTDGFAGNANIGRGASAVVNGVRLAYTLFGMSEKDAAHYAIPDKNRHRYVRLDMAKTNFTALNPNANWLERVSVDLPGTTEKGYALVPKDLNGQAERRRKQWAFSLRNLLEKHPDGVTFSKAAEEIFDDAQLSDGLQVKSIAQQIGELFVDPCNVEDFTVVVDVTKTESGRNRKRLIGYV